MHGFELTLLLLVVVAVTVTVSRRLGTPYPILLVLVGLAIGLLPEVPRVELEPDLVLVVFLPPLLFAAAWQTPIRDFRQNLRPIALLSVGLVLFTTVVVAVTAVLIVPGLPVAAAFALGAIVAPPDAIAATAILRRLNVRRRIVTVLEGESLVNDATALTAYRVAVIAAMTGVFVVTDALGRFTLALLGGVAIGLAVAVVAGWFWRRLFDPPVEVALSAVIPYAAYLPAEQVGASGVIAVVTAGLYLGYRSSRIMDADARILAGGVWQIVTFLLNGFAFLLIGLQLPFVIDRAGDRPTSQLLLEAGAVCLAVVLARLAWVYPATYLPRRLSASLRRRDPAPPPSVTFVIGWAGMRGAVSLAAALALPVAFPQRDLLLFLTFAVILVTLVGQGLTLPALVRRLGLSRGNEEEREEREARATTTRAALMELSRLRDRWPDHRPLIETIEARYLHRVEHLVEEAGSPPSADGESHDERAEHLAIMAALIFAERESVIELRDRGVIGDEVLRRIERELDLEELRLAAEA